ncbi:MAG: sugar ABC transporter permease [Clostridia bacterium]|nr:sugar ABC transporter permease [Clostridia bacterium]
MKALSNSLAPNKRMPRKGFILRDLAAWMLMVPTILILYFWIIRPIATGIIYSFCNLQGFEVIGFAGLDNYRDILSDTRFAQILSNTMKYVIWSLIIGYIPPMIVAVLLNEMVHAKGFFRFSIYFPCMISSIAASLIWYYMYLPDASGLLNRALSFIGMSKFDWLQNENAVIPLIVLSSTWKGFGGTMLMYLASLQGVNQELYDASLVDGAGFIRRFRTVTFPHIRSIMLLFLIQQIIGVFQILTEPMTMTGGGPNNASMSMGLWSYNNAFVYFNTGHSLTISVVMFLILIVLTFFYFALQKKVAADE